MYLTVYSVRVHIVMTRRYLYGMILCALCGEEDCVYVYKTRTPCAMRFFEMYSEITANGAPWGDGREGVTARRAGGRAGGGTKGRGERDSPPSGRGGPGLIGRHYVVAVVRRDVFKDHPPKGRPAARTARGTARSHWPTPARRARARPRPATAAELFRPAQQSSLGPSPRCTCCRRVAALRRRRCQKHCTRPAATANLLLSRRRRVHISRPSRTPFKSHPSAGAVIGIVHCYRCKYNLT